MSIFSKNDPDIKKSYLLMLIKLSNADHKIDANEARFIRDVAKKLGLSEKDVINIDKHPEKLHFALPDTLLERMQQFYHLLFLMGIDGEITHEEREMCRELGFRLCLNPSLMDDLINLMIDNLSQRIPEGEMLEAVKKYLN